MEAAGPEAMQRALQDAIGASYALERELGRGGMATIWLAALPASATDVPLSVVQFPERSSIDLQLAATIRVAPGRPASGSITNGSIHGPRR